MKKKAEKNTETIEIVELQEGEVLCCILGTSPLIMNRLAEKARQELLIGGEKKNAAERKATLKHDPVFEFRSSLYRAIDDSRPTRLHFPVGGFLKAMATAALRIPGANKTAVLQLVTTVGVDPRFEFDASIYGIPQLYTTIVRQSDQNRTPDIRTRGIIPMWGCPLKVRFIKPGLTERTVINLLAGAGKVAGLGDNRRERGGLFGSFRIVSANDPEYTKLTKIAGRKAQDEAILSPDFYNAETEELVRWFFVEAKRREKRFTDLGQEGELAA
jgi:hypothetical protein